MIVQGRVYAKHERSLYAPVCITLVIFIMSSYFLFLMFCSQAEQMFNNSDIKSHMAADERIMQNVSRPIQGSYGRRYIITTAGTYSYREHLSNLACSLGASKSRFGVLVLALDSRLYQAAKKVLPTNVHTVLFSNIRDGKEYKYHPNLTRFGTPEFASLSRRKLAAARAVLAAGYDVLFVDGDVVFCDSEAAISTIQSLVSQNEFTSSDIIAQRASVRGQVFNTGFYYARANSRTISLLEAAENMESPHKALDDQIAMNQLACHKKYDGKKLINGCLWRNETKISIFPNDTTFPLGCTTMENGKQLRQFRAQAVRELCYRRKVALVHYSCWGGDSKKPSMISRGMWFVDEKTTSQCLENPYVRN